MLQKYPGISEDIISKVATTKPHVSLKKIADNAIHVIYGSQVGNLTF